MKPVDLKKISRYVKENIGPKFHDKRLNSFESIDLHKLLKRKNPYLFKAKNVLTAEQLVRSFLEAHLSSSEEEIFGDFLEDLAIYIAQDTLGATKSTSQGLDFEYTIKDERYIVAIKSGLNWGNSSQWAKLEDNFKRAMKVLGQSKHVKNVHVILGVGYGKAKTTIKKGFIKQVCGQEFWNMVSGDKTLYTEIIEPLGTDAGKFNTDFEKRKAEIINKFTRQFIDEFCDKEGKISWEKLVRFNSGNMEDEPTKDEEHTDSGVESEE